MNINLLQNTLTELQNANKEFSSLFGGVITYNENLIAKDFFPTGEINENIIQAKISQFEEKKIYFKNMFFEISENENFSQNQKEFILGTLEKMLYQIECFQKSIYLEAEKSGKFAIHSDVRRILLQEINHLQDKIYGPEISQNATETQMVLTEISNIFQRSFSKISPEEQGIMEKFFQKFNFSHKNVTRNNFPSNFLTEKKFIGTPEEFQKIIQNTLDLYNLYDWKAILSDTTNMFLANRLKKQINIPTKNISSISIFRLLQLLDHEIGVHAVRSENTHNSLKITGANYLESEEGLATHSEEAFYKGVSEISGSITEHHIATFIAENYDAANTEKILQIFYKLLERGNPEKFARDRMLRVKRFVSFYEK